MTAELERFRERLATRTGHPDANGCWPWTGGLRSNGYGMFGIKRLGKWTQTTAHRIAYQVFVGPIPDGYEVDHLCHNRKCVNPHHLEAVTIQENRRRRNARKTTCIHGHTFEPHTTRIQKDSNGYRSRICRICENARHREQQRLRRAS